jgi:2'-5' RNA ligase
MRLFVAIQLEKPVKDLILGTQQRLRQFDRVVRWVRPEQMHLTLAFLGDVDDGRVPSVCEAVEAAGKASRAFDLAVVGSGCFPPRGRVRVVWVGVDEPSGALQSCQEACATGLEAVGFPRESRPFSPHLTLGRVKDDNTGGDLRRQVERLDVARVTQSVGEIHVVQSELLRSGARYTTVGRFPLLGS